MDEEEKTEQKRPIRFLFFSWEPMLFLITITVLGMAFVYLHPVLQPFLEEHVMRDNPTLNKIYVYV